MKKFIVTLVGAVLALALSSNIAVAKAKSSSGIQKMPSYLFVVQSKTANIKQHKHGGYLLIMKKVNLNQVIEFSDQPFRVVKYITGSDLQNLWNTGVNSFKKDPVNAVLVAKGEKAQIIVLHGITVTNNTIAFPISATNMPKSLNLNDITVVIDKNTQGNLVSQRAAISQYGSSSKKVAPSSSPK